MGYHLYLHNIRFVLQKSKRMYSKMGAGQQNIIFCLNANLFSLYFRVVSMTNRTQSLINKIMLSTYILYASLNIFCRGFIVLFVTYNTSYVYDDNAIDSMLAEQVDKSK